jgi:hypothetical protein
MQPLVLALMRPLVLLHASFLRCRVLLANKADWKIGEEDGYTCLHGAGFQGRAGVARAAISFGLPPDDLHQDGYRPLHRAAWGNSKGHADTMRCLPLAWALGFGVWGCRFRGQADTMRCLPPELWNLNV